MSTTALLCSFLREQNANEFVDVFVPGETGSALAEAIGIALDRKQTKTLTDNENLISYVKDLSTTLSRGRIGRSIKKLIDNVVSISWSPQETGAGKIEISFLNGLSANEVELPDAYVLRRDSLQPQQISAFLSLFSSIPIERRPKVIFDAEKKYSECLDMLSYSKSAARVFVDAAGGLSECKLDNRAADDDSFLSFYEANALAACAAAHIPNPNDDDTPEDVRSTVVKIYLQVQAKKRLGIKFDAIDQVAHIQKFLTDKITSSPKSEQTWLKEALFFFCLDQVYINESASEAIERASAIAYELQNRRLIAHAQRMINLSAGISPFSSAQLREAAETFTQFGDPLGYLFCLNNRLVNDSHLAETPLERNACEELVDFGFRTTPYSDRLSSVCSTAGVNALLQNDLQTAVATFTRGESASGLRLHHLTASVNRLIAEYVSDGAVRDDELCQLCQAIIAAKMPRRLDYHHTYLLGNLERLAVSRSAKRQIQDTLISQRYMPYSNQEVRDGKVLEFLIPRFSNITDGKNYKGHRGIFFARYGLLPINHFIWS